MSKKLHISPDLALPLDAVTQTFAVLAKRRVGKTYTASVLAEEMVAAGLPFVALDPTGAWWGLRSSADGQHEGLPVVIIGGQHGDIPLEPTAGKVIAELVVDHPGFYVLDLSATESDAEQDRFATDFATRLYRYKEKHRDPLHLFIDEADSFAPQKPFKGQERMLGAFEALVRRGGIRGIGMTLITQRPAVLNKNVLTQCECLIVLQMTAPQDQDAIDDWVRRNGTKEQRDTLMASLASLQRGEAWVWSPAWLEAFKLIHVRERHTFNSSATPKAGEKAISPQHLAPVDLEQLRDKIASTIEKAKAEDPAELRRQIAELQKQLKARPVQATGPLQGVQPKVETKIEYVDRPVLNGELPRLEKAVQDLAAIGSQFVTAGDRVVAVGNQVVSAAHEISGAIGKFQSRPALPVRSTPAPRLAPAKPPTRSATPPGEVTLRGGERAIMTAVAQYPDGVTREQLTVLTGYKRSSRDTFIQRLAGRGLVIIYRDKLNATEFGIESLGSDFQPLPTGAALIDYWRNRLTGGERAVFEVLVRAYPNEVSRDALGEEIGYKRSSRDTYIQRLQARQLVTTQRNAVRASDELFRS